MLRHGRHAALVLLALGTALASATAAAAATPVDGSIAGPVVAVKGKTFTVTTALSPTGRSKVTVTSKTVITTQAAGTARDVKRGVCAFATGTKKGSAVAATRVALTPPSSGQCGQRPSGAGPRPGGGAPPRTGGGSGFSPPANFAFAAGTVSSVKGSSVTLEGPQGSTTLTLSSSTRISETVRVGASAIKPKLCVFVRGTSADKGVTVSAESVELTKAVSGSCTARRRGP